MFVIIGCLCGGVGVVWVLVLSSFWFLREYCLFFSDVVWFLRFVDMFSFGFFFGEFSVYVCLVFVAFVHFLILLYGDYLFRCVCCCRCGTSFL